MSFTPLDGYAIVADLRCGDNALDGVPELGLESSSNEQVTADNVWDADPSDGFDSGWVNVEVDWNANGEIDFNVNGTVISYNGGPYDDFYGFVLRSGVSAADSTVAFRNVSAQFFHSVNGIDLAQVGITDDAVATTAGNAQPDAESIVVTVPNGGGIKSARLFAQVRMQSPDLPNPTDLFGQIFIYAAPHS